MSSTTFFHLSDLDLPVMVKIDSLRNVHFPKPLGVRGTGEEAFFYVCGQITSSRHNLGPAAYTSLRSEKYSLLQGTLGEESEMKVDEWLSFHVRYKDQSPNSMQNVSIVRVDCHVHSTSHVTQSTERPSWLPAGLQTTLVYRTSLPIFSKLGKLKSFMRQAQQYPPGPDPLPPGAYKQTESVSLGINLSQEPSRTAACFAFYRPQKVDAAKLTETCMRPIIKSASGSAEPVWLNSLASTALGYNLSVPSTTQQVQHIPTISLSHAPFSHPVLYKSVQPTVPQVLEAQLQNMPIPNIWINVSKPSLAVQKELQRTLNMLFAAKLPHTELLRREPVYIPQSNSNSNSSLNNATMHLYLFAGFHNPFAKFNPQDFGSPNVLQNIELTTSSAFDYLKDTIDTNLVTIVQQQQDTVLSLYKGWMLLLVCVDWTSVSLTSYISLFAKLAKIQFTTPDLIWMIWYGPSLLQEWAASQQWTIDEKDLLLHLLQLVECCKQFPQLLKLDYTNEVDNIHKEAVRRALLIQTGQEHTCQCHLENNTTPVLAKMAGDSCPNCLSPYIQLSEEDITAQVPFISVTTPALPENSLDMIEHYYFHLTKLPTLIQVLLTRACWSTTTCVKLFWLFLVAEEGVLGDIYSIIQSILTDTLHVTSHGRKIWRIIDDQKFLLHRITTLYNHPTISSGLVDNRVIALQKLLNDNSENAQFEDLTTLPRPFSLPLLPDVKVLGLVAEKCSMFKSAKRPVLATFTLAPPINTIPKIPRTIKTSWWESCASRVGMQDPDKISEYKVMFKCGDDLRQDQLVCQMFRLFDIETLQMGIDGQVTNYNVVATSASTGYVEMVMQCTTLENVINENDKDISKYLLSLKSANRSPETIFETYLRSLAAYCVTTRILGIGDRHLENIMVCQDGRIVHIDFGFMFNADPKPMQPPVKLTREMVQVFGGDKTQTYVRFLTWCSEYAWALRTQSGLHTKWLIDAMAHASLDCYQAGYNTGKHMLNVIGNPGTEFEEEKQEADMVVLLNSCINAMMGMLNDKIHTIAVSFK